MQNIGERAAGNQGDRSFNVFFRIIELWSVNLSVIKKKDSVWRVVQ